MQKDYLLENEINNSDTMQDAGKEKAPKKTSENGRKTTQEEQEKETKKKEIL